MSLWEFRAAVGGYIKANSVPDAGAISSDEAAAIAAALDARPVWH
jgi:hypothetical protein